MGFGISEPVYKSQWRFPFPMTVNSFGTIKGSNRKGFDTQIAAHLLNLRLAQSGRSGDRSSMKAVAQVDVQSLIDGNDRSDRAPI